MTARGLPVSMPVVPKAGEPNSATLTWLYVLDASLLLAHEIDSAFWHEWELFHLPGDHGLFTWIHVPLAAVVIWGAMGVAAGRRAGIIIAMLLATGGTGGGLLHAGLLWQGDERFRDAPSVVLIAALLIASLGLLIALILSHRSHGQSPAPP